MKRKTLEFQADQIEAVLSKHKAPGRVTGGLVSPRWVKFDVLPTLGARVSKIKGLAEELALALGSESCRVSRQGDSLAVEIPRLDPQPVHLLPLQGKLTGIPFGAAVLGLGDNGAPLLVRLPAPDVAHVLIAGTTGSGKTALARSIVISLALTHRRTELGLVLIDPKGRAFGPLAGLPHLLRPVIKTPDQAGRTLDELVNVMLARDGRGQSTPLVVVVIDELADLLMSAEKSAAAAITRLAQRGREAGIHLIACTQKPISRVISSLTKANFPLRLVGKVASPEDARCAAGVGGSGAERLTGKGDFVAVTNGRASRFQAAYISNAEIKEAVADIQRATRRLCSPRKVGEKWQVTFH